MKKTLVLYMAICIILSLCACSQECSCNCEYCCNVDVREAEIQSVPNESIPETAASVNDDMVAGELQEAELAVEDFELIKFEGDELWFRVKIRNISDRDMDRFSFEYQVLDKNGDILRYQLCGASTVAAGQAIWAGQYSIRDLRLDEVDAMSFVSDSLSDDPPLKERVIFRIEDYL